MVIDGGFEGGGAAFFEGVDHAGFEGRVLFDLFDRFGADHGLPGGGVAVIVLVKLGEQGFDLLHSLGEVLAVVDLSAKDTLPAYLKRQQP